MVAGTSCPSGFPGLPGAVAVCMAPPPWAALVEHSGIYLASPKVHVPGASTLQAGMELVHTEDDEVLEPR